MLDNMIDRISELPTWFTRTAAGAAIARELEARKHAAREPLVERLTQRRRDLIEVNQAHAVAEAPLLRAVVTAREKLSAAERRLLDCRHERAGTVGAIRVDVGQLERQLRESASTAIDQAAADMFARFDRERDKLLRWRELPTGELNEKLQPVMRTETNERAIAALRAAMCVARDALDALKLQNPDDVDAAIAAILAPVDAAWASVREFGDDDGPAAA